MCRRLKVSTSGFHAWHRRPPSQREPDNQQLLALNRELHTASDGVMSMPRMHEELGYERKPPSRNRVARLMANDGLYDVP